MNVRWIALLFAVWGCAATIPYPTPNITSQEHLPMNLVNLARTEGTRLYVPSASEDYPPRALVDGVRRVDVWERGSGWELVFDGAFLRNRLFKPENDPTIQEPLEWLGLRRDFRNGKEYSAFGWILLQLPGKRTLHEVVLYSVDTPEYPATRFGVRDVLVEVWDEPTDRWVRVVPLGGNATNWNSVEDNVQAELRIRFQPVRSDLVRVAIRWTNEAEKTQSFTVMGRREEYAKATIRLTEVELYGVPEPGDTLADVVRQHLPEVPSETSQKEATDAVLTAVRQYLNAFADHDLETLMNTIAPTYFGEGENREKLRQRLHSTFEEFPYYLFTYTPPRIEQLNPDSATVVSEYSLQLSPLVPRKAQGSLVFTLLKVGDTWMIQEIRTLPG